ncbi:classical arabinogalactan protein 25 [Momordica charantia]|uniref:Classical arabinogalactan protein 25 n=1 Tax=Momordica charantia TaxID=3673 RepID=A0A6J1CBZ0_MOMCH|nr:classical arabinogalactan protein 25 [Momordica charantia]
MASFWYCSALIMAFMASTLLALPSDSLHNPKSSTIISASPSLFTTNSPQPISPFQELSPEIAPLLPSPGGNIPSATGSIPTIPSNPSPPNPDEFEAPAPDPSALSPFGLPGSFAPPTALPWYSNSLLLLAGSALFLFSLPLH